MFDSYGVTDTGCVRSENQDRILLDHSVGLFMVADGMGGHKHGEIAAELAVTTLRYYVETSRDRFDATWPFGYDFELSIDANRLSTGIQLANQQVWSHARQTPECAGMGTTIAAILLSDEKTVVGNVGDSRVYLFRAGDLKQISYDDTYVNAITEREGPGSVDVHTSPMRNVLTQAAGSEQAVKVHISEQKLESGDLYLICSDGLHGVIGDAAIRSILATGGDVETTARHLNETARVHGGPDNISVVLLSYS
jgi:serine/threonine protein phosphatase PrpC